MMAFAKKIVTITFVTITVFIIGYSNAEPTFHNTFKSEITTILEQDSATVDSVPTITINTTGTSTSKNSDILASNSHMLHLGFAGDINLDENWPTTAYLNQQSHGIYDCISPNLITLCNSFDIFMLNNEFSYSNRGTPLAGKAYTFRARPERVQSLQALGTDIVLLANNHIYDYGKEAFLDTLTTLETANIDYVGAGRNDGEACRPVYYTFGNTKIAYVAATRAEKYLYTPESTASTPGVLRAYDPTKYLSVIKEAKANSDYVIASIHWGTEYSSAAEQYQQDLGHAMIDAGADAVIGSHTHVLQGIEYYNGKPIMYSLGNFWFNEKDLYSCVIELTVNTDNNTLESFRFIPCTQKNCYTNWPENSTECRKILDFEEDISFGIQIDDHGYVFPLQ